MIVPSGGKDLKQMTPKELIDKITLAAEQLESLRTEYDLPARISVRGGFINLAISNKKHLVEVDLDEHKLSYYRQVGLTYRKFNTYEELVEDIKNR